MGYTEIECLRRPEIKAGYGGQAPFFGHHNRRTRLDGDFTPDFFARLSDTVVMLIACFHNLSAKFCVK